MDNPTTPRTADVDTTTSERMIAEIKKTVAQYEEGACFGAEAIFKIVAITCGNDANSMSLNAEYVMVKRAFNEPV
jgi:hypothetical protein